MDKSLFVCLALCLFTLGTTRAQYASLPYYTGFESGVIGANWTTESSDPLGRVQTWSSGAFPTAPPVSGNWHLGLDTEPPGGVFTTNAALLHVNLSGEAGVRLEFWWMEWNDETHPEDGIYFSDNAGAAFTKVLDLPGSAATDLTWQNFVLDIDALAATNGLTLSSTFIIKFQQHDNFYFNGGNDGFFFDNVSVTSDECLLDTPVTAGHVDLCGPGVANLSATGNGGQIVWYNQAASVVPIATGPSFATPYLDESTTYYTAVQNTYTNTWSFLTQLEGWVPSVECALPSTTTWQWNFDLGNRAAYAADIAENTSQLLSSRSIDVGNAVLVDLEYEHRYNTETCCDHGYVVYRLDGGAWQQFVPTTNTYNIFDFMYNDPIFGACANSPDLSVYAGDSGGYLTSSGQIDVLGAETLEVAFLFTSDPAFGDEGWFIREVSMGLTCESQRQIVSVNILPRQENPDVGDATICDGSSATLNAFSNTPNGSPIFDWYDQKIGGNLVATGASYSPSPRRDYNVLGRRTPGWSTA